MHRQHNQQMASPLAIIDGKILRYFQLLKIFQTLKDLFEAQRCPMICQGFYN
jgi:hypothetical protein